MELRDWEEIEVALQALKEMEELTTSTCKRGNLRNSAIRHLEAVLERNPDVKPIRGGNLDVVTK